MSHQEKQEIFDQYAEQQGYSDWNDLKSEIYHEVEDAFLFAMKIDKHIFAACDLVQEEQQNRIAENARIKIIYAEKDDLIDTPIELGPVVDKNTITDPKNIIK